MKNSISFCIASAKNEKYYTLGVLKSLEDKNDITNYLAVLSHINIKLNFTHPILLT